MNLCSRSNSSRSRFSRAAERAPILLLLLAAVVLPGCDAAPVADSVPTFMPGRVQRTRGSAPEPAPWTGARLENARPGAHGARLASSPGLYDGSPYVAYLDQKTAVHALYGSPSAWLVEFYARE